MTPEGKTKKAVRALLDEHKAFYNMPVPGGYGESLHDFVGCHRGLFFTVECKFNAKLTPRQNYVKERIEEAGGVVFVVGERVDTIGQGNQERYSGMIELEAWLLLS